MYQFLATLLAVISGGYLLEHFLMSIFGFRIFRLITAPGIIIHEASHALVAKLFGAQIKSFKIFKTDGGEVAYTKPYLSFISIPLISLAPILGCSLLLYLIGLWFGFNFHQIGLEFSWKGLMPFLDFWKISWLKSTIFFYLILSLTSAMAPSKRDFANCLWGLAFFLVIFFLIYYFRPETNIIFLKMSYLYLVGLYMLMAAFIISIVLWIFKSIFIKVSGV